MPLAFLWGLLQYCFKMYVQERDESIMNYVTVILIYLIGSSKVK